MIHSNISYHTWGKETSLCWLGENNQFLNHMSKHKKINDQLR